MASLPPPQQPALPESLFTPEEMLSLARDAGFAVVRHVSAVELGERYSAGPSDGLRPPRNVEELLVATT